MLARTSRRAGFAAGAKQRVSPQTGRRAPVWRRQQSLRDDLFSRAFRARPVCGETRCFAPGYSDGGARPVPGPAHCIRCTIMPLHWVLLDAHFLPSSITSNRTKTPQTLERTTARVPGGAVFAICTSTASCVSTLTAYRRDIISWTGLNLYIQHAKHLEYW
nr:MAG: hypothetical protein [Molluscum contagiosum virus]